MRHQMLFAFLFPTEMQRKDGLDNFGWWNFSILQRHLIGSDRFFHHVRHENWFRNLGSTWILNPKTKNVIAGWTRWLLLSYYFNRRMYRNRITVD